MSSKFLLYGATGFVGEATVKQAIVSGLQPVIAGRDNTRLANLAAQLGVEYRAFTLEDPKVVADNLPDIRVVLNCAGPFTYTFKPLVEACLKTKTHYLDITGELPVYQALYNLDHRAQANNIMLLPGIGFDVVPTDCLALHLKQRLPSATSLTLAFQSEGPAGLPPGTQRTMIEMIPYGNRVRRDGRLVIPKNPVRTRRVDFGDGEKTVTRIIWGDVFTAYISTGIPNIEDYTLLPESVTRKMSWINLFRPLFKLSMVRNYLKSKVKPGPGEAARAQTTTHVWGQVKDEGGNTAVSRLHGPEAGVVWTVRSSLEGVRRVLEGNFKTGYQTPAMAYGADFVVKLDGVTREDIL